MFANRQKTSGEEEDCCQCKFICCNDSTHYNTVGGDMHLYVGLQSANKRREEEEDDRLACCLWKNLKPSIPWMVSWLVWLCLSDLILWFLSFDSINLHLFLWHYPGSGSVLSALWMLAFVCLPDIYDSVFWPGSEDILTCNISVDSAVLDFWIIWILGPWTEKGSDFKHFGLWPLSQWFPLCVLRLCNIFNLPLSLCFCRGHMVSTNLSVCSASISPTAYSSLSVKQDLISFLNLRLRFSSSKSFNASSKPLYLVYLTHFCLFLVFSVSQCHLLVRRTPHIPYCTLVICP